MLKLFCIIFVIAGIMSISDKEIWGIRGDGAIIIGIILIIIGIKGLFTDSGNSGTGGSQGPYYDGGQGGRYPGNRKY